VESWLRGNGCVPIYNLMEDAATAEISRAQLWQWIRHRSPIQDDGDGDGFFTPDDYIRLRDAEMTALRAERTDTRCLEQACELLDELVLNDEFIPFLTLPAYQVLH
jgi:malate synthase